MNIRVKLSLERKGFKLHFCVHKWPLLKRNNRHDDDLETQITIVMKSARSPYAYDKV